MDELLRNKIEAVLFSIGKKIHIDELMRMIKEKDKAKVVACLIELKKKYNEDTNNSLQIMQDGDEWKLTIKDQYIDVAKEIGIETELPKSVMETLAVIAYKDPVMQCDVIKIRTNKAYDHLKLLEEMGYIQREKYGRTKKIKLAQKFFDYFELPPEALKEKFKNVAEMEKIIKEKEVQMHEIKEQKNELIDKQKRDEKEQEKINIYMETSNSSTKEILQHDKRGMDIITGEVLGELEVFDEPEQTEEEKKNIEQGKPTGERLGELEIIEEPEKDQIETNNEELSENELDVLEQNNEENEKEISDLQELKDKINQELTDEDNNQKDNEEDYDNEQEIQQNIEQNNSLNKNNNEEDLENGLDESEQNQNNINQNSEDIEKNKEDIEDDDDIKEKNKQELNDNEENNVNTNKEDDEDNQEVTDEDNNPENNENDKQNIDDNNSNEETNEKDESKELGYVIEKKEDEDINKKQDNIDDIEEINKHLKEDELFQMEGIPDKIMEQITKKAERITGEVKDLEDE
jgi:segregation and condensation protein B